MEIVGVALAVSIVWNVIQILSANNHWRRARQLAAQTIQQAWRSYKFRSHACLTCLGWRATRDEATETDASARPRAPRAGRPERSRDAAPRPDAAAPRLKLDAPYLAFML